MRSTPVMTAARAHRLGALGVLLLSGLAAASAARAGAPATLALAFPDATLCDMRSAAGAANDAVHRNGLALTVSGELTKNSGITIFALEVKGGRVVKRSQSDSPLPGRSATTEIPDVLSNDHYHGAVRGRTVAAADALRAVRSDSASALSPFFDAKQLGQVTVVFVAIPTCASTDKECGETRTQPVGLSIKVLMVGGGCAPAPALSAGSAAEPTATELGQASAPAASSEKTSEPQSNCRRSVGQVAGKTEKKARSFGQFASAVSRIVWHSKVAQTATEAAAESDATANAASAVGDLAGDAGGGADCEPTAK